MLNGNCFWFILKNSYLFIEIEKFLLGWTLEMGFHFNLFLATFSINKINEKPSSDKLDHMWNIYSQSPDLLVFLILYKFDKALLFIIVSCLANIFVNNNFGCD